MVLLFWRYPLDRIYTPVCELYIIRLAKLQLLKNVVIWGKQYQGCEPGALIGQLQQRSPSISLFFKPVSVHRVDSAQFAWFICRNFFQDMALLCEIHYSWDKNINPLRTVLLDQFWARITTIIHSHHFIFHTIAGHDMLSSNYTAGEYLTYAYSEETH